MNINRSVPYSYLSNTFSEISLWHFSSSFFLILTYWNSFFFRAYFHRMFSMQRTPSWHYNTFFHMWYSKKKNRIWLNSLCGLLLHRVGEKKTWYSLGLYKSIVIAHTQNGLETYLLLRNVNEWNLYTTFQRNYNLVCEVDFIS